MSRLVLLTLVLGAFAARAWSQGPVVEPIREADKQPGYGTVESVKEVRVLRGERSAAAGGSGSQAAEARPAYRVSVRMADGSVQYRDLHKPEFKPGDNVLLTNAGEILKD